MKRCPICGSSAFEDATTCFECLYSFERMSCVAQQSSGVEEEPQTEQMPESQSVPDSGRECVSVDPTGHVLVVRDTEFGERRFSLDSGSLHVGRLPTNEVVLNDKTVSRRHLHVYYEADGFWVEDFCSTNKSTLNGARIEQKMRIAPGDIVQVRGASVELRKA